MQPDHQASLSKNRPFYSWLKWILKPIKKPLIGLKNGIEALIFGIKMIESSLKQGRQTVICCMDSPNTVGGAELLFRLISKDLKESGLLNMVITTGRIHDRSLNPVIQDLKKEGIVHIHINGPNLTHHHNHSLYRLYLSFLFRRLKTPILHLFNPRSLFLIPAAKLAGMQIVYHEMGLPKDDEWWSPLPVYMPHFDHVISVSKAGLILLRERFSYQGGGTVIHSIIDPPPLSFKPKKSPHPRLNLIFFGNIFQGKGVDILVKAFKIVLKSYPYSKLTIIGRGPCLDEIKQLATDLHLTENIRFLGYLERKKIFDEMENSDIFCLPSFSEGCPCSIIEAMSAGLPVIATTVGGIPELVIQGETGLLISPHNIHGLSGAIEQLAQNGDLRMKMSINAFNRYLLFSSREDALRKLTSIYQMLRADV
ncbi:MAG: glycosyltransferase [Parachlamydiaceae bacterium]